jgi:hypothetical protein
VQGEILEFWRAVEMFSPPAISPVRPSGRVFDVNPGEVLPWTAAHPFRRQRLTKLQAWRHVVYLGIYAREEVFEALKSVFPVDNESYEERPSGSTALLAFAVSEEGTILEDWSLSVSSSSVVWTRSKRSVPRPRSFRASPSATCRRSRRIRSRLEAKRTNPRGSEGSRISPASLAPAASTHTPRWISEVIILAGRSG